MTINVRINNGFHSYPIHLLNDYANYGHSKMTERNSDYDLDERLEYKLNEYTEIIKYGKFSYRGEEISFNQNSWKVKASKHESNTELHTFIFGENDIPLKCFMYELMSTSNQSCKYMYSIFLCVRRYMRYIDFTSYDLTDSQVTIDFLESLVNEKLQYDTILNYVTSIQLFLKFLNQNLSVSVFNYNILFTWLENCGCQNDKVKYKLLEYNFYNKMCILLKDSFTDKRLDMNTRKKYACLYCAATTGLRITDVCNLPFNPIDFPRYDSKKTPFLKYSVEKTRGTKKHFSYLPLSESLYKDIQYIQKLSGEKGKKLDLLFPQENGRKHSVYNSDQMENALIEFCFIHRNELNLINKIDGELYYNGKKEHHELSRSKPLQKFAKQINELSDTDTFYYPNPHQFRVFCISQYFDAGVSGPEIAMMYHHFKEEETWGYFRSRVTKNNQANSQVGQLELMAEKDSLQLSGKDVPQAINVHEHLDDILEEADGFTPISKVDGGYCLNANGDECEDAAPKHFIMPSMYMKSGIISQEALPVLLEDLKSLKAIIDYNEENGFIKQAEKEKKKMKMMLNALNKIKPSDVDVKEYIEYAEEENS